MGDGDRAESSGVGEVDQGREREGRAISGETQRCIVLFVAKHAFSQFCFQVSQLIQIDWPQKHPSQSIAVIGPFYHFLLTLLHTKSVSKRCVVLELSYCRNVFVQTQVALLLPLLVSSHQAKLGPYDIDSMSVIYRGIYMYSTKDSPKTR